MFPSQSSFSLPKPTKKKMFVFYYNIYSIFHTIYYKILYLAACKRDQKLNCKHAHIEAPEKQTCNSAHSLI